MPTIAPERAIRAGYDGFLALCERIGFEVEPFQRRIARAAFDARELLVLLPRGNGKSRLVGTLAVHHLTTEKPAVYVAASSREQARIVFEYARDAAYQLDDEVVAVGSTSAASVCRLPSRRSFVDGASDSRTGRCGRIEARRWPCVESTSPQGRGIDHRGCRLPWARGDLRRVGSGRHR